MISITDVYANCGLCTVKLPIIYLSSSEFVDWPHEMISIKFPIEDFRVVWMCLSDVRLREYGSRMEVNNRVILMLRKWSCTCPIFSKCFILVTSVALMQACSYFSQITLVDELIYSMYLGAEGSPTRQCSTVLHARLATDDIGAGKV
jgi:hypothetical protein